MASNNNKDKCNVPHLRFPEFTGISNGEHYSNYILNSRSFTLFCLTKNI